MTNFIVRKAATVVPHHCGGKRSKIWFCAVVDSSPLPLLIVVCLGWGRSLTRFPNEDGLVTQHREVCFWPVPFSLPTRSRNSSSEWIAVGHPLLLHLYWLGNIC